MRQAKSFTLAKRHLEEAIKITEKDVNTDKYLHGLHNGLQMAKNCITGKAPDFKSQIGRYRNEKFKRGLPR